MLCDDHVHIRELAMRRILAAREEEKSTSLRKFQVPTINCNASNYIDMIDWRLLPKFDPPLFINGQTTDIKTCIQNKTFPPLDFVKYPCHTQAVERSIRLVSEASSAVSGEDARDGFIRARIQSRGIMKSFNTKREYNLN